MGIDCCCCCYLYTYVHTMAMGLNKTVPRMTELVRLMVANSLMTVLTGGRNDYITHTTFPNKFIDIKISILVYSININHSKLITKSLMNYELMDRINASISIESSNWFIFPDFIFNKWFRQYNFEEELIRFKKKANKIKQNKTKWTFLLQIWWSVTQLVVVFFYSFRNLFFQFFLFTSVISNILVAWLSL